MASQKQALSQELRIRLSVVGNKYTPGTRQLLPVAENAGLTVLILTHLVLQSRFGDKPLGIRMVCPQVGTAVLKGIRALESG